MIHKTAIIDPQAKISSTVDIGPYSVIGPNVEINENVVIQSHVNITGHTKIGKNNNFYPFSSIGNDPQDMKYKGEKTELIIGNNNTIREYVTINPGTVQGGGITKVGNNNLIMISAHIAHDCIIGNNIVIANSAAIAGHAEIDDYVVIGGNCGVQQFTRIGKMAMIGGMTGVSRDVIPYGLSTGNRNYLNGINVVGLRRSKRSNKEIMVLIDAYKEIFKTENLNNNFYPFTSIGNNPQDMKYKNEKTELIIGNDNTIREYVTINPGTVQGGGITKVGNNNLIMISAHIAHDCIIGNNIVIANSAAIAGHTEIDDHVVIGGNCGVQQFTRIGKMAMIGGMTGVSRDVIPYGLSTGNRNYLKGINVVGLRRNKTPNKEIIGLTDAYKEIFKTENLTENLNKLNGEFKENNLVKDVVEFINKDKKRPICTPFLK